MTTSVTATVHGLGELLALVPYQLGFEPGPGVLALLIRRGLFGACARLPAPECGWEMVPLDHWGATAQVLRTAWVREDDSRDGGGPTSSTFDDGAILVAYDLTGESARDALLALSVVCGSVRVPVTERLVVSRGRWRRTGSEHLDDWQAVPQASCVPAVSEFVGRGVAPLPGRGHLEECLEVDPARAAPVADALRRLGGDGRAEAEVEQGLRAVTEWLTAPGLAVVGQEPASTAQGLELLARPLWRDALYHRVAPALFGEYAPTSLEVAARSLVPECGADADALLVAVAPRAPAGHRSHLLALIAVTAWANGRGPLAAAAAEAALRDDPAQAMAGCVAAGVGYGLSANAAEWRAAFHL